MLRRHPMVREVACTGVPDELRGEEVLACIVPRQNVTDPSKIAVELVELTLRELAYFKAPGYVAFRDHLPLTSTNKMQRGELKAMARSLPGTADCVDTRHLKKRLAAQA